MRFWSTRNALFLYDQCTKATALSKCGKFSYKIIFVILKIIFYCSLKHVSLLQKVKDNCIYMYSEKYLHFRESPQHIFVRLAKVTC
jgi:hypothetical protein